MNKYENAPLAVKGVFRFIATGLLMIIGSTAFLHAAEPSNANKNYLGINVDFCTDWSGTNAFSNIMIHARYWRDASWTRNAVIDSDGWPEEDCSTVIFGAKNQLGVYKLIFKGQADSITSLFGGSTVSNKVYDAATNTTTADVTLTDNVNASGLVFTGTRRQPTDAAGTGISDVRMYRPGEPTDGSSVLSSQMKALLEKFQVVRFMNWTSTNTNPLVSWSQRMRPGQAKKPNPTIDGRSGSVGLPFEYMVAACNETNTDMWINLPVDCDNDFITKLAELIRYGSDGVNPYTSPQAHPVWAPLNPNLKVYVEYGNEIWNTAGGFMCYQWIKQNVDAIIADGVINNPIEFDGNQDETTLVARYAAWREVTASTIFRSVFGDAAMNTRVRPVMMGQIGGNWANPRQLPWINAFYGTARPASDPFPNTDPHPVDYYLYGAGGSAYYGVNNWSTDPDTFFDPTNYPSSWWIKDIAKDAVRSMNYGLKRIAYEGGLGLDSSGFTDAQKMTMLQDPRMQNLVEAYHNAWSNNGGDLLVYYVTTGAIDWEFTWDPAVLDSPKLKAADDLVNNSLRAPVTLGTDIENASATSPAVANAVDQTGYMDQQGTTFSQTIQGEPCLGGVDSGEWVALACNAPTPGTASIYVRLASSTSSKQVDVTVNGAFVGSITFTGQGNGTLMNTSTIDIPVKQGLNVVRIGPEGGSFNLRSVDFTSFVSSAPTVADPVFDPDGGSYATGQTVSLSTATDGASIRYTTDGSTPDLLHGTLYSGPISVSSSETIRAIAFKAGDNNSSVVNATYEIGSVPAGPTGLSATTASSSEIDLSWTDWSSNETGFSIERKQGSSGTYAVVGTAGPGATTYKDTGLNPETAYIYRVRAEAATPSAYSNEATATTASAIVVDPVFAPTGGTYTSPQSVTISTATAGASIRYTTDGSTPSETAGTLYSGPINVSTTETLQAVAYESGMKVSSVISETYTVLPPNTTVIQAEAGTYGGGSAVRTALAGYTGNGYVDFGGYNSWSQGVINVPADGTYTVLFRYANGSSNDRNGVVAVNGSGRIPLAFPNTGGWTTWGYVSLDLSLTAGDNTVRITASTGNGGPNFDAFLVAIPTAAAPTFLPTAGTYSSPQDIVLSTATAGAGIRYTTDGTTPTKTTGILYDAPIHLSATATVKAIAFKTGLADSSVSSAAYSILTPPTILQGPKDQTITAGDSVDFSVSATGTSPISYQWRKDGQAISGATGSTLTISPAYTANAGLYDVVVSNVAGSVTSDSAFLKVNKAQATVSLGDLTAVYDGATHPVSVSTTPGNLNVNVTYNGSASIPTDAGQYAVVATVDDPNYEGSASGTLIINPMPVSVTLKDLLQFYDGSPKAVSVVTDPESLPVTISYEGDSIAPTLPGSYAVKATVTDPNYSGSATGQLTIDITALVGHAPSLNGGLDGSMQVLLPETATLNGGSWVSGDILAPGMPTVRQNGHPTFGGIIDSSGSAQPDSYEVVLNGHTVLRHLVRRVDPIEEPVLAQPPAPGGTRSVSVNNPDTALGDFATISDLTLNGNVGQVSVPPGNYGNFIANAGSGFTLGIEGSAEPTVYNFQSLVLNGNSRLAVAGPVIIHLANGVSLNGDVGSDTNPGWVTLTVFSGGVTLNGKTTFDGAVIAPSGTVTINGSSTLTGSVKCARLVINGAGLLRAASQ